MTDSAIINHLADWFHHNDGRPATCLVNRLRGIANRLTAPESSPAPLESQEELIDEIIQFTNQRKRKYSETVDFLRQFHLTRRTKVSPCDSCDHESCGYPNSDCRDSWKLENKVSPGLDKFHDLENDYKVTE